MTVPQHPPVADGLARAVLQSLLESKAIGLALVRAPDWSHVMTSATYERLVGTSATLGTTLADVLTKSIAPPAMLEQIIASGETVTKLLARKPGGALVPAHVSFTFLRVRQVSGDADGILVLAEDVSRQIHDQRIGELFVVLANDLSADGDDAASVRLSVSHAAKALGATAASIFLLSPDGGRLQGALVGWDWTRTSFDAELDRWPTIQEAVIGNRPIYVTANTAKLDEREWFERRGIRAAICAPMAVDGRVVGVLFFDYASSKGSDVDVALAKSIADRCALLVERAARASGL